MNKTCVQCGNTIPERKRDYVYKSSGEVGLRAGERLGSTWMMHADPDRFFCTMRCAARYGIRAAKERSKL